MAKILIQPPELDLEEDILDKLADEDKIEVLKYLMETMDDSDIEELVGKYGYQKEE